MNEKDFRTHYISLAGSIALIGNLALAITKLVMGFLSSSMAVIGDGIDSSTDVLIAIVTLVIGKIITIPSDTEHPWGHARAETTATLALSFIIFFAGAQLVLQSAQKIIINDYTEQTSMIALYAAVISIIGKTILAFIQYRLGSIADSQIVKANAMNMKNDIIMSASVLIGLILSKIFKAPILDPIIALVVGLWVIKNAAELCIEMNTELMDGNVDKEIYKKLFEAVSNAKQVYNPHSARIRKMASSFDIDLDVEVEPSMTVYEAHEIIEKLEESIRKEIPDIYAVTIHMEPLNSSCHQPQEEFGLSPDNLQKDN